jgi:signal transduction histidine kinase
MRLYLTLERVPLLRSYPAKFFAVAFIATHLPLLSLLAWAAIRGSLDISVVVLVLLATLAGTGFVFWALHHLLAPVRASEAALAEYGLASRLPALPTQHRDTAGRLMAATQDTLIQLDAALTAAQGQQANAVQQLEQRTRALAEVTHELKTPLGIMLGFAELMTLGRFGPLGNARYESFAADIRDSGQHMLSLVEDIQRYANLRHGKEALNIQPVVLSWLADRLARMMHLQIEAAGMRCQLSVPESVLVMADSRALTQVLLNLMSNAVKYAGPGTTLSVAAAVVEEVVAISVADDGVGLSEEEAKQVLEPFARTEASRRGAAGLGLGLPLARMLVELHGGRLRLDSVKGRGTTVTVTLPSA